MISLGSCEMGLLHFVARHAQSFLLGTAQTWTPKQLLNLCRSSDQHPGDRGTWSPGQTGQTGQCYSEIVFLLVSQERRLSGQAICTEAHMPLQSMQCHAVPCLAVPRALDVDQKESINSWLNHINQFAFWICWFLCRLRSRSWCKKEQDPRTTGNAAMWGGSGKKTPSRIKPFIRPGAKQAQVAGFILGQDNHWAHLTTMDILHPASCFSSQGHQSCTQQQLAGEAVATCSPSLPQRSHNFWSLFTYTYIFM